MQGVCQMARFGNSWGLLCEKNEKFNYSRKKLHWSFASNAYEKPL